MRKQILSIVTLIALLLAVSSVVVAQTAERAKETKSKAFDPHDLSGVWGGFDTSNMTKGEPPMTAWGLAKYKNARSNWTNPPAVGSDDNDPVLRCEPPGVPRLYSGFGHPVSFMQDPDKIVMLYEADRIYRIVYMKRDHPKEDEALWFGDSTGKWEGNTLVVDTIDFNDRTWIDHSGHPHSDKMHLVERWTRVDHDHLHLDITVDDLIAYTKPWGGPKDFKLEPDWELEEYMCSPSDEQQVINQVMVPEAAPADKK